MSSKGKGGRGTTKKTTSSSRSKRAGLTFPVGRIARHLKQGRYAKRIGSGAPIFMAAVLEYLCFELLDVSLSYAKSEQKQRITPRHIQLAIRSDEEFSKFLRHITISSGGVVPNIHAALVPKSSKKAADADSQ